jgi:hypothetical protein
MWVFNLFGGKGTRHRDDPEYSAKLKVPTSGRLPRARLIPSLVCLDRALVSTGLH